MASKETKKSIFPQCEKFNDGAILRSAEVGDAVKNFPYTICTQLDVHNFNIFLL